MRTIGKLAAAAAIALAAATGAVSASVATSAAAAPPWHADTVYYTGGVVTGSTRWYCNGTFRDDGDVLNYDEAVYTLHYECP